MTCSCTAPALAAALSCGLIGFILGWLTLAALVTRELRRKQ